jgi:hypothetical protein
VLAEEALHKGVAALARIKPRSSAVHHNCGGKSLAIREDHLQLRAGSNRDYLGYRASL